MGVSFSGGFKPPKLDLEKTLARVLEDEKSVMDKRITSGRDSSNSKFKSYTPEYKKFKESRGRNASVVDMTFTGKMLQAIIVSVKRSGSLLIGEVKFGNNRDALKARGNIERGRKFFGFTKDQFQRIRDALKSSIK